MTIKTTDPRGKPGCRAIFQAGVRPGQPHGTRAPRHGAARWPRLFAPRGPSPAPGRGSCISTTPTSSRVSSARATWASARPISTAGGPRPTCRPSWILSMPTTRRSMTAFLGIKAGARLREAALLAVSRIPGGMAKKNISYHYDLGQRVLRALARRHDDLFEEFSGPKFETGQESLEARSDRQIRLDGRPDGRHGPERDHCARDRIAAWGGFAEITHPPMGAAGLKGHRAQRISKDTND